MSQVQKQNSNVIFLMLITGIWLILLALCAIIGVFIVPFEISTSNYLAQLLVGSAKVIFSMLFIVVWLFGWYKAMNYVLLFEFYSNDLNGSATDN